MRALTRATAVIAAFALLLLGGLAPASPTEAAWVDREHAAGGVSALRLQPPAVQAVTTCARPSIANPGLVNLAVQWSFPSTASPYSGFTAVNATWTTQSGETGAPSAITPTTTQSGGVYTASFSGTLLGNLVGGILNLLLGTNLVLKIYTTVTYTNGSTTVTWVSPNPSIVRMNIPSTLSGQPTTCTFSNGT
ncbi:hypothetical protein [Microbacterium sp. NPDC055683]